MIDRSKPRPIHRMPTNPKPTLEMQRLPVFRVHYEALEAYVRKVFGFTFDFMFAAGVTEDCGVEYVVTGTMPQSLAWERKAADLRLGKRTKDTILILNVLAADGYIPRGQYTISTHKLPDPTKAYTALLQRTGNPLSPECLRFKEANKGDRIFTERAAILDKTFTEAKQ